MGALITPDLLDSLPIWPKEDFLETLKVDNESYLGLFLPNFLTFEDLDSQERHIISKIQRVSSNTPPLLLLPVASGTGT